MTNREKYTAVGVGVVVGSLLLVGLLFLLFGWRMLVGFFFSMFLHGFNNKLSAWVAKRWLA